MTFDPWWDHFEKLLWILRAVYSNAKFQLNTCTTKRIAGFTESVFDFSRYVTTTE